MAYRKLYGMVFENGDRLPTMIVDVDGSDTDVEADDDTWLISIIYFDNDLG